MNKDLSYKLATMMDAHHIVYMWRKMRGEFSDPVREVLDTVTSEHEFFYVNLFAKLISPKLKKFNIIIIAKYKEEPIGFGLGDIRVLDNSSHLIGHSREIYAKERFRNKGVEGSIRLRIIEEFKKRNVSKVLYDIVYNDNVLSTYSKLGFKPIRVTFMKEEG